MKTIPLPLQNRQLIEEARKAFRPTRITPSVSNDLIMYEAGTQAVLEWMDNYMSKKGTTTVTAPTEEAALPDSQEGFLRRIAKGAQ